MVSMLMIRYPKGIEKLKMNRLEIILDVQPVYYSFRIYLQKSKHHVSQSSDKPKRDKVYFTKYYIEKLILGVIDSRPKSMPLRNVSPVMYLTSFFSVFSPVLYQQIVQIPSQLKTSFEISEGLSMTLQPLFLGLAKQAVIGLVKTEGLLQVRLIIRSIVLYLI